jgi:Tol biopolymer transport system component
VVRDLVSGQERTLASKRHADDYAETHAFSRDGSRLVYSWYRADRDRYELHLTTLGADLSHQSRPVLEGGDWIWMGAYDWSPDGSLVAISFERPDRTNQIGILRVADGSVRILKSTGWRFANAIAFSPDGRYLAFDLPREESEAADVFTLAVDGSGDMMTVVGHPGDDDLVAWSPDGGYLLFESDRGAQRGLWRVAVRNGAADGQPHLVRGGIEPSFAPIGFNSDGDLLYWIRGSLSEPARVQMARVNFVSDTLDAPPENLINEPREGTSSPQWSRDGRMLGYLTRQPERAGSILTLRSSSGGPETVVRPRMRYFQTFSFSPDARAAIAAGGDFRGRFGLFKIDLSSGETQQIVRSERLNALNTPVWSRDGRTVFYARNVSGSRSFVVLDLATGNEREVARGKVAASARPGGDGFEIRGLNLSPDDQYIATVNNLQKPFSIVLISVKDGVTRTLLESSEDLGITGWAPDSRAFYASRRSPDGKREVVRISVDGDIRPAPGLSTLEMSAPFSAQPGGSLIAFPTIGGQISAGNAEVWALENILPAIKAGR